MNLPSPYIMKPLKLTPSKVEKSFFIFSEYSFEIQFEEQNLSLENYLQ